MYTYLCLLVFTPSHAPPPPCLNISLLFVSPLHTLLSRSVSSPRSSVLVRLSLPFALQSRFISVHDSFCSISSKVSRFVHSLLPLSLLPLLPKKAIVIHGGNPSEQIFSGHFMYKHAWLSITGGRKEKMKMQKSFVQRSDSIRNNQQMFWCDGLSRSVELMPSVINRLVSRWWPQTSFLRCLRQSCHSS